MNDMLRPLGSPTRGPRFFAASLRSPACAAGSVAAVSVAAVSVAAVSVAAIALAALVGCGGKPDPAPTVGLAHVIRGGFTVERGGHSDRVRGPARVEEDTRLALAEVPVAARFPMTVAVWAYQLGSRVAPLVQPAEPVRQIVTIE